MEQPFSDGEPIVQLADSPTPPLPPPATPPPSGFDLTKLILPGAILIAAVLISGSILYARSNAGQPVAQGEQTPSPKADVSVDDDPALGNANAPVTIIEFSDYQCPFCRTFWKDTYPQLKTQYIDTGKVRFVYRDYPLSFHASAMLGAEAANCALAQGKYWQMHDEIFAQQQKKGAGTISFTQADTEAWAKNIGLDVAKFRTCVTSGQYTAEINKDMADAAAAQVDGTPTFFINGTRVVGAQPFSVFKAAIDAEL